MMTRTLLLLLLMQLSNSCKYVIDSTKQDMDWWKSSIVYQIYPRSFKDSNGDGIGDLPGITSKLEYLKDLGVTAVWMSPIYKSPQVDFGYDISNFTDIHNEYGTLNDFDELVTKAHELGLKVILDFVPNHSSNQHEWFEKSVKKISPYDDYYIWKDPKYVNGVPHPPNNWLAGVSKSAWEWNEERKQYYYHAFTVGQPDLNYRNPKVRREMEGVFEFWIKRGVDGLRVDAINMMFEDEQLRDEPISGIDVPEDDFDRLEHIYTRDMPETYEVIGNWSRIMNNFVAKRKTDAKILLMEVRASLDLTMKYYDVGSIPFNFMLILDLFNHSSALEFKKEIDRWNNALPKGEVTNWVTGNHDNHRVASRFGFDGNRADQLSMMAAVLPGISVIYNGDEIGMRDREFTYEETVDPLGCILGPDKYYLKSRDPERTPFQWDDTTSAGFSTNENTWLPVNENYKTLNLAAQKLADVSHYKVFKALGQLKKQQVMREADNHVLLATDKVLAVVRKLETREDPVVVVLLTNFSYETTTIDARSWLNIPEKMSIYIGSVKSGLESGKVIDTANLTLAGAASVIVASLNLSLQ